EAANQVAQRICDSIANDGMGPLLSVSIGVAVYPHDGERIEALLRKADVDMYGMKAKKRELRDDRQHVACQILPHYCQPVDLEGGANDLRRSRSDPRLQT